MKIKLIFHYISYLQYPLMIIAIYFVLKPYFNGLENTEAILKDLNSMLVFMGLGISFSTLQDTTKTQNKMSEKTWKNPKKGKLAILSILFLTIFLLIIGLVGYFSVNDSKLKDLSIGIIILGIGLIGMLKTAVEMFENYRNDKNTTANTV